jgi:hypothetical protein
MLGSTCGLFVRGEMHGVLEMRNSVPFVALGVAFVAGTSAAHAQAVETIVAPAPGPAVIAQAPVVVPPSGVLLAQPAPAVAAAPVETIETVRSVETTAPRPARRHAHGAPVTHATRVTTRTTVREGVAPAVAAYNELLDGPRYYDYAPRYDYAPPAAVVPAPVAAVSPVVPVTAPLVAGAPIPTYRYVYEADRILVIDPYTNIAVQAIPR